MAEDFSDKEPSDLQDLDTPSYLRKDRKAYRIGAHVGGNKNQDKMGGSTGKTNPDKFINPMTSTIPMNLGHITSLDSLDQPELDSYKGDDSLKDFKTVVKTPEDSEPSS